MRDNLREKIQQIMMETKITGKFITKYELRRGMKIRTMWKKGKTGLREFRGTIIGDPKKDAKESARITRGRFISFKIITEEGKIIDCPYTMRTIYEVLN